MHDQTQFLTSLLPYCVNIYQLFTKIVESVEIYHMNLGSGKIKCCSTLSMGGNVFLGSCNEMTLFVKKVGICITLNTQENSQNKIKFAGRNDTS